MHQLFLLRHGQSIANAEKKVCGSLDSPLSELGKLQAHEAGKNAKRFFAFDLIVTSPLIRARVTATIIANEIGLHNNRIIVLDDLRERHLGSLEGVDYADAPQHNGNYEDAENAPGIEPISQLYQRAQTVLQQLKDRPESSLLIICHNGIGRMLQTVAQGGQPLGLYDQPRLDNAIIYRLSETLL